MLWISAAEFPPDPKFLRLSFCGYTRCFTLPAFVALLLTRWLVACTDRESGSHHVREGCSPMVLPSLQGCPEGILLSLLLVCPSESANDQRLGKFLLWISAAESPDYDNISRRAFRQAEILAVDFRRRISARSYFERTTS